MFNAKTWHNGEKLAQEYLKKQGYKILETNMRLVGSEVDIVAVLPKKLAKKQIKKQVAENKLAKLAAKSLLKNQTDILVFVEVKARQSEKFGMPQEAVTTKKQFAIKRFARAYLLKQKNQNIQVRFDVVAVTGETVEHIENAFA